jgi:hypothetical protein
MSDVRPPLPDPPGAVATTRRRLARLIAIGAVRAATRKPEEGTPSDPPAPATTPDLVSKEAPR